jgi:hypothetical protein
MKGSSGSAVMECRIWGFPKNQMKKGHFRKDRGGTADLSLTQKKPKEPGKINPAC